ncbi:Uncharacterized conserved protein [Devosia sp. YR412]|uniref:GFA family protein n=1 Tax=Devosia sp. YR412 TaxID=1881030 RepID=UPI0008BB6902|nr:GFA family protein [Devosia sp. YR412]SEP77320.1 Uncharacterized conserved protein [Devosia sp. YR412]
MHKGSCLCGAVRLSVTGDLAPPSACHCTQCRKHTGHFEAGTDVLRSALTVVGEDNVTWFHTAKVRRGFCAICGSSLFFDAPHMDRIGINMGVFDTPTHVKLAMHIFVADKGDYYDITDGLPQNQQ